jgi:hypothetical protein
MSAARKIYPPSRIKRTRSTKAEVERRRDALYRIVEGSRPATMRQVYYLATVEGLVPKTENGYDMVQTDLTLLPRDGTVPYDWLADSTRWQRKPTTFSSVEEALEDKAGPIEKPCGLTPTPMSKSGSKKTRWRASFIRSLRSSTCRSWWRAASRWPIRTEEQDYAAILAMTEDAHCLPATFASWREKADRSELALKGQGQTWSGPRSRLASSRPAASPAA